MSEKRTIAKAADSIKELGRKGLDKAKAGGLKARCLLANTGLPLLLLGSQEQRAWQPVLHYLRLPMDECIEKAQTAILYLSQPKRT